MKAQENKYFLQIKSENLCPFSIYIKETKGMKFLISQYIFTFLPASAAETPNRRCKRGDRSSSLVLLVRLENGLDRMILKRSAT